MFLKGAIPSRTKGRKIAIFATTMVALMSVPAIMYSFGANPPLGNTGAPSQGTCATCHGTLTAGSGVTVTAPTSYTPGGAAVSMTVSVPTSGGTSQGFELAILTQSGNAQAGTLAAGPPPAGASFPQDGVSTVGTVQYVFSTVETTSWTFSWTPPATNVGNVVVYVTGGSHGTNFSNSFVISAPSTTPPPATLASSPASLTFTVNGAEPATQQVMVTSSVALTGTVTTGVSTSSGGNWLTVMPPGGNTPLTATVGIDATVAASLGTGTYQGSVSFTNSSASNSPLSVPVTLTVTTPIPPPVVTPPTLTVNSTGLNFTATVGAAAPSSQSVTVSTSNGSAATFTDSATTSSGGSWLSVDTAADTTPTSEPISIATVPSTPGTYQGTVTFTSSATSPNSVTLPVTLTVNSPTTTPPPTTGLPWSFNANVVDRLIGGSDYMLLTGNGGMNSTSQLSGSGSFTRFKSLTTTTTANLRGTAAPAAPTSTTPIVANGRWRVTGMTSSNLTTSTTTSSTGVTTTRVTGGTVVLQVSITIQGCNSGGGEGEGEGGTPGTTPSPITGTLTVVSTGGSTSGISLTYQGTCASTSSTGTTTTAVSGSFMSVGIGTYSLGGGGGDN